MVKGQFLSAGDRLDREYPDAVIVIQTCFAIRLTTVVNQARGIPADFSVQIRAAVQRKEIAILFQSQLCRLLFRNRQAHIFDETRTGRNVSARENASTMNPGFPHFDPSQRLIHLRPALAVCSCVAVEFAIGLSRSENPFLLVQDQQWPFRFATVR
jgi:hypothetical protein